MVRPQSTLRALVVEDDLSTRAALASFLRHLGLQVDIANSSAIALRLAKRSVYDVVFASEELRGMGGAKLMSRLLDLGKTTALVLATEGRRPIRFDGHDGAAVRLVSKPWDWNQVVEVLDHLRLSAHGSDSALQRKSILVVEDNPVDADLLCELIELGFAGGAAPPPRVVRADSLDGAFACLAESPVAVILADLSLPDSYGLQTIDRLAEAAPGAAVIVVTGHNDDKIAIHSMRNGAQDYLVKGKVDPETLQRSIRYAVERKSTELRLCELAHFDQLTGVANRITFNDRLVQTLSRARRKRTELGVMYIDLDHFKAVNDTHGHRVGDELLAEAAGRICEALRDYDTVARLGGDEFAVIIEEPTQASLHVIADRVVGALDQPFEIGGAVLRISSSVGVSVFPSAAGDAAGLLDAADRAMYTAKRRGRNQYCISDSDVIRTRANRRSMSQAIEREEFVLHYQPQLDLKRGVVCSLEALVRWQRSADEVVMPAEFLPRLEESGLIVDAGRWVLDEACRQLSRWSQQGLDLRLAVNVSPRQFESEDLAANVAEALTTNSLDANTVEIEITETTVMRDTATTRRNFEELKEIGVRVSLDDFGSGFSSLACLQRYAVDALKIDRSFISGGGDANVAIVNSIISLAAELGLDVVAEGVETGDQLDRLVARGCTHAQGFHLAYPQKSWTAASLHDLASSHQCLGAVLTQTDRSRAMA